LKLYRTKAGFLLEHETRWYAGTDPSWDSLVTRDDLDPHLKSLLATLEKLGGQPANLSQTLVAPIAGQEVWAAGVTYHRSRDARIEEAASAGGGDFYDRVYQAARPELFFKATPHRVVGPGGQVAVRQDAQWSVPEPELALLISPSGKILGYTVGNDMSSRDIEGENPLYLPQAKVYNRSCALGPCILVSSEPLSRATEIHLDILRQGQTVFQGSTSLKELKRELSTLVRYLYLDNSFPQGCFLLTGTGIVPPDSFSLRPSDEIRITIEGIGTLANTVG